MKRTDIALLLAGSAALGAGCMYLFDPQRGRRRRALLRDKTVKTWHVVERAAGRAEHDLADRVRGAAAVLAESFVPNVDVDDVVLAERARSAMGHVVSHPGAIDVSAEDGCILLRGTILEPEFEPLLAAVGKVRGVREVRSWLRPRPNADHDSSLQGGKRRIRNFFEKVEGSWSPGLRLLCGLGGLGLIALGARRRDFLGVVAGSFGAGAIARAVTTTDPAHLLALDSPFAVHVEKSVNIAAPLTDVYQFWADPRNYPHVFARVKSLEKIGDNLYHWNVAGPGGLTVGWDGTIVEAKTNERLAFKSVEGALVGNEGLLRFDPNYDGSTRVQIRMSYYPPIGILGHLVAEVFGVDPGRQLDEDLNRLKSLFERGKTRVNGKPVSAVEAGVEKLPPLSSWQGVAT